MSVWTKKSRGEISFEEATRDPVFLFQFIDNDADPDGVDAWRTDGVFLTREEAMAWGEARARHYDRCRVYCVNARGELALMLATAPDVLPQPKTEATP